VFGDSKLVVKKIKNQCPTKHPILKAYQNEVCDLIENFFLAFNTQVLLREHNRIENSLSIIVSNFKPPQNPLFRYEVDVRYKSLLLVGTTYHQEKTLGLGERGQQGSVVV